MEQSEIITLVIATGVIGLSLIIMACFLLAGRGANLIAGYNTLSPFEKTKYDEYAMCRFMGKILLPIGILCPLTALAQIFHISWGFWVFGAVTLGLCIFALVYCNTGERFRKK